MPKIWHQKEDLQSEFTRTEEGSFAITLGKFNQNCTASKDFILSPSPETSLQN